MSELSAISSKTPIPYLLIDNSFEISSVEIPPFFLLSKIRSKIPNFLRETVA